MYTKAIINSLKIEKTLLLLLTRHPIFSNKKQLNSMDIKEIQRRMELLEAQEKEIYKDIDRDQTEEKRFIKILDNTEQILNKLEDTFEERTSLS